MVLYVSTFSVLLFVVVTTLKPELVICEEPESNRWLFDSAVFFSGSEAVAATSFQ